MTETDKQGLSIALGGSAVNNLADNLHLFTGGNASDSLFGKVYKVFGDIVVQQYPNLVASYPAVDQVLDVSYLTGLKQRAGVLTRADVPTFTGGDNVKDVVSRKAWRIPFETGKATFTPQAQAQLQELLSQLSVAGGLAVEVHGHTDSVGSARANHDLSERRALAVRQWLESKDPADFPEGRVRTFAHGDTNFIAANDTETGRTQNRRVEIVLGSTR